MMTSSNGNIFRVTGLCAGNSPITGKFPTQRPVTRSFGVFFDLRLNKRLSKQSWGWWFETPSGSLWRHCNGSRITGPWWGGSAGKNWFPSFRASNAERFDVVLIDNLCELLNKQSSWQWSDTPWRSFDDSVGSVLLSRCDAVTSLLANGSAPFI